MWPLVERRVMRALAAVLAVCGMALTYSLSDVGQETAVLRRHKRAWQWNVLFLQEESQGPFPQHIGKLSSDKANEYTKYEIEGEGANTIFEVRPQGDIFATQSLDREIKKYYELRARLIDTLNGNVLDREEKFNISITDINDNAPVFQPLYEGSIAERSSIGTKVLTVAATDADDPTTLNGQLEYRLLNGTQLFSIDRNGIITTRVDTLDREKQSVHVIVVLAKDMPGYPTGGTATTTVTINVNDINDNAAVFKKRSYTFDVKENEKGKIGVMDVDDKDEEQNKTPFFIIDPQVSDKFKILVNPRKDGDLTLMQGLDYEKQKKYKFSVNVNEDNLANNPDNTGSSGYTRAEVTVNVVDVNEPPVFAKPQYNFSVIEDAPLNTKIGSVEATDPDAAQHRIRYHIDDPNSPVRIDRNTGDIFLVKLLDREQIPFHKIFITAEEDSLEALKSTVAVNLIVMDVNDNPPELVHDATLFVCEKDGPGTVIQTLRATDKDDHKPEFSFKLAKPSANFTLINNYDNSANITVTHGGFDPEQNQNFHLEVVVMDKGSPPLSSTTTLTINVCTCGQDRSDYYCKPAYTTSGVGFHALIAVILCILIILVIVILIVLRKRYQKEALVTLGKSSGEIHEQLVRYDEEGGGEMDTNGYDVSVLTSARHDGTPMPATGPALYATVKRPSACRGNMATMIDVKKDEADHDRDVIPYDTLHIYGYEGPESLAGSLSSLGTSSDHSTLDYDFLNEWGPRFKTLAELYGVDTPGSGYTY